MQEPTNMFPSQWPDLLLLLRTIARIIITVDYNLLCSDPSFGNYVCISILVFFKHDDISGLILNMMSNTWFVMSICIKHQWNVVFNAFLLVSTINSQCIFIFITLNYFFKHNKFTVYFYIFITLKFFHSTTNSQCIFIFL